MPTSSLHQISDIVEMIAAADPRSVLDVGVGVGGSRRRRGAP